MSPFRTNESPKCTESTCDMHKRRVRWRERWEPIFHGVFGVRDPWGNVLFALAMLTIVSGFGGVVSCINAGDQEDRERRESCFRASESVRDWVRDCAKSGDNKVWECKEKALQIHEDCLDIPR